MKKYLALTAALALLPGVVACNKDEGPTKNVSKDNNQKKDDNKKDDDKKDDSDTDKKDDSDTDKKEDSDIVCPEEDFHGCIENKDGTEILLECDGDKVYSALTCDLGRSCIDPYAGTEDEGFYFLCGYAIPEDSADICADLDDGYHCLDIENQSWSVYCDTKEIDFEYSSNCGARGIACDAVMAQTSSGTMREFNLCKCTANSQCPANDPNAVGVCDNGVCYEDCKEGYEYSMYYGTCEPKEILPDAVTAVCAAATAPGYYCAKDGDDEWYVACMDGDYISTYTINCTEEYASQGYTSCRKYLNSEYSIKLGCTTPLNIPAELANMCNGITNDFICADDNSQNGWYTYCYDGEIIESFSCTSVGYDKCGEATDPQSGETYMTCVKNQTVGCQNPATDCNPAITDGYYTCEQNMCAPHCNDANAKYKDGKCVAPSVGCQDPATDCKDPITDGYYTCEQNMCVPHCNDADAEYKDGKCVAPSVGCQDPATDCKDPITDGYYTCETNMCVPHCNDADAEYKNGVCEKAAVEVSSDSTNFNFITGTDTSFTKEYTGTSANGANIVIHAKADVSGGHDIDGKGALLNAPSDITVSLNKGLTKVTMDILPWEDDDGTIVVTPDSGTAKSYTFNVVGRKSISFDFSDAANAKSFKVTITKATTNKSRVTIGNLKWFSASK